MLLPNPKNLNIFSHYVYSKFTFLLILFDMVSLFMYFTLSFVKLYAWVLYLDILLLIQIDIKFFFNVFIVNLAIY